MDASAKILEAIGYGIGRLFRFSYDVTASSIRASAQTRAKTIHGFPLESRFEQPIFLEARDMVRRNFFNNYRTDYK